MGLTRGQLLFEPIEHFAFKPSDPVRAELYSLWKLPGFLQSCDVLRRVQDKLLQLTFR